MPSTDNNIDYQLADNLPEKCQKWFVPRLDHFLFFSILVTIFFIPLNEKIKAGGFLITLVLWILTLVYHKSKKNWISPLGWCFIFFVGVAFLSALFSDYHNRAARGALDAFRYTTFFLIIINKVDTYRKIEQLVQALISGIAIGDIVGIYRYFYEYTDRYPEIEILSLGEQNSVAQVLAFVFALLLGLILTLYTRPLFRFELLAVTGLTSFDLILTYSREIWLAIIVMLILFLLLQRNWKITVVLLGLIVVIYQGNLFTKKFQHEILTLEDPLHLSTTTTRFLIWKESLEIIKDHPVLGIGAKTYGLAEVKSKYHLTSSAHAHNMFINVAAELGILGLIALCLWLAFLLRTLLQIYSRMKTDINQGLWLAGLGCFIILIIGGLAHPMLGSESSLTLMTVLGLMLAGYRIENENTFDQNL